MLIIIQKCVPPDCFCAASLLWTITVSYPRYLKIACAVAAKAKQSPDRRLVSAR